MRKSLILAGILVPFFAAAQTPTNLYPGPAPGSEKWTAKEISISTPYGQVLQNVSTPTITPYLPDKSRANRTAIIIAPGGACIALAMEHEGTSVARWLQEKGFAAFVLKYRIPEKKEERIPAGMNFDEACKYGIADGIQAMKLVRQRAVEWGISPDRVGFLGFSAGAMVTSGVLLQPDPSARPNFAAPIYGGPFGVMPAIPANLPPIFMAWAQDDDLVLDPVNKFYSALKAAGNKPEIHVYRAGGHGFGMKHQGTTSDHWIDEFYFWLDSQGLSKPAVK
jgi:acetyl esterase/lipase